MIPMQQIQPPPQPQSSNGHKNNIRRRRLAKNLDDDPKSLKYCVMLFAGLMGGFSASMTFLFILSLIFQDAN